MGAASDSPDEEEAALVSGRRTNRAGGALAGRRALVAAFVLGGALSLALAGAAARRGGDGGGARPQPRRPRPGSAQFDASAVRLLDTRDFDGMLGVARAAPRGRKNFNFHAADDALQAFVNAWSCDAAAAPSAAPDGGATEAGGASHCSYVQPHRHREPESVVVLRGALAYFVFDGADARTPRACHVLRAPGDGAAAGPAGAFVAAGVWHSMAAFAPAGGYTGRAGHAVVWEVKLKQPGQYTVAGNKAFLNGSLPEAGPGSAAAQAAVRAWMRDLC